MPVLEIRTLLFPSLLYLRETRLRRKEEEVDFSGFPGTESALEMTNKIFIFF